MTTAYRNAAPHWLTDAHEMPVNPGENPPALWSENYLMYVWSPANAVGIYWHLCRTLGEIPIWNEQLVVALPGGRYLASKGQSRGEVRPASLSVVGLQVSVNIPFRRLNVSFRGGARLLSRDEFHSCPVQDGAHVPVDINLGFDSRRSISVPGTWIRPGRLATSSSTGASSARYGSVTRPTRSTAPACATIHGVRAITRTSAAPTGSMRSSLTAAAR